MWGRPEQIISLTNNPDKIAAIRREGIDVQVQNIFDPTRGTYYNGGNYLAKVGNDGHGHAQYK